LKENSNISESQKSSLDMLESSWSLTYFSKDLIQ